MTEDTLREMSTPHLIDRSAWGPFLTPTAEYLERVASALVFRSVQVTICRNWKLPFDALYGPGADLTINYSRVRPSWFVGPVQLINELMLLTLAHHFSVDKQSVEYREGLATLAARMAARALSTPEIFSLVRPSFPLTRSLLPERTNVPPAPWLARSPARRATTPPSRNGSWRRPTGGSRACCASGSSACGD